MFFKSMTWNVYAYGTSTCSRSQIVLIRRWATGGRGGGGTEKPVVRPADASLPPRRRWRERRRPKGARRALAWPDARFRWMASAGHEPASNQDGKRRWDHASCTTRSVALRSLPSSLFSAARRRVHFSSLLAARSRSSHPSSSYFGPALLYYLLFCHCYYLHYYYVSVTTGFRIWWCIVLPLGL